MSNRNGYGCGSSAAPRPPQPYIKPKVGSPAWYRTTTTVWRLDETIKKREAAWRRKLNDNGRSGFSGAYKDRSKFPATLCEYIILRYSGETGGLILDAFAGGPVRAAISALMGHRYVGYEIRQEQINKNIKVLTKLSVNDHVAYRRSDGTALAGCADKSVDFAFSCPPYYDQEPYSDLPEDLSNLPSYDAFIKAMLRCARSHYRVMKPGAFVCMVAAPFRLRVKGGVNEQVDLPGDINRAFKKAGFHSWQKITVLRNPGSAPVRAAGYWRGEKLVQTHEELLVFRMPGGEP